LGFLKGGFSAWKKAAKEYDTMSSISTIAFQEVFNKNSQVFDVRKESEFKFEHVLDAKNSPLDFVNNHISEFPTDTPFYMHCAGGYRSVIAASILKSIGIHNLINIEGGFEAMKEVGISISDFVCPSTL
jgi:hydroxyacylglutathione hydrolase